MAKHRFSDFNDRAQTVRILLAEEKEEQCSGANETFTVPERVMSKQKRCRAGPPTLSKGATRQDKTKSLITGH